MSKHGTTSSEPPVPGGAALKHLLERLHERGFQSVTLFAKSMPAANLNELASHLGDDIAPIQIHWAIVGEGFADGTLRQAMQELVFRRLRNVAAGWPSSTEWEHQKDVRYQLTAWEGSLSFAPFQAALKAITNDFLDATDIPSGWRPDRPDDPHIASRFDRFWPHDETEQRAE